MIEEVGDLGGTGKDGDACFCRVALLFAGVDGREEEGFEEDFAEGPFPSLVFQDVASTSEISGVAGVTGRGRVPLSPRRVDRPGVVPVAVDAILVLLFEDVVV